MGDAGPANEIACGTVCEERTEMSPEGKGPEKKKKINTREQDVVCFR